MEHAPLQDTPPPSGGSPSFLAAMLAREMLMAWDGHTVLPEQSTSRKETGKLDISNLSSWLGNQRDTGQAIVGCWEVLRMWVAITEMGAISWTNRVFVVSRRESG